MSRLDRMLRRVAAWIVRGPDARFILGDLDELLERDRAAAPGRARLRYALNALGSALTIGHVRLRAAARGAPSLRISWLDLKLAARMLVKHPGITAVAVFALSLGIPASLVPLHILDVFDASLPFDEGDRIVGLRHWRTDEMEESAGSAHEYQIWSSTLTSFEGIGAARRELHNVIADDGRVRAYRGGLVTASTFGIVRVPPLLGRSLVPEDEAPGAPDVVVLGYDAWQTLLDGDPRPMGRVVHIGNRPHTVVGVMPEGFLFPYRDHFWIPLRGAELPAAPAQGPELWIFGRLAPGVSAQRAQAEMAALDTGLRADFPGPYDHVRAEVVPFTTLTTIGNSARLFWMVVPMQVGALLLLAVACGNVGTLIFARTVARTGEVAVRTALGASRGRIVSQLFVESLVLALLATGVGLAAGQVALDRFSELFPREGVPFWIDFALSPRTVALALALAAFSAVIAGVLPALKATGGGIHGRLQRAGAGRSGTAFGRATTGLIVTEVALGVTCLFICAVGWRMTSWNASPVAEIPTERFLTAQMTLAGPAAATSDDGGEASRAAALLDELVRRLQAEPGVLGVALTSTLPRQSHSVVVVEVEGDPAHHAIVRARVDVGYFEGLAHPARQGRDFAASDLPASPDEQSSAVIVNTSFVARVLRGGNAVGRRVRYPAEGDRPASPWYEITGVVGRLGTISDDPVLDDAALYQPIARGSLQSARLAIRLSGDPAAFAPRLREIAAGVDPAAIVADAVPLAEVQWDEGPFVRWVLRLLGMVAAVAVVLSVAGLYALMSFTVAQRTREIGVRAALGANASRIMSVVAGRAALQLALGVAIAAGLIAAVILGDDAVVSSPTLTPLRNWPWTLALAAGLVVLIATIACIGPTLRGVRIKPMEAMRS